ncbi:MAG: amidohydrolase [Bryobacterales bacterium]|nr:amidohydrolase [Bryobacterales bacterium]
MTRRDMLASSAATALASALPPPAANPAPVVNCAEHVWVVRDPRFPIRRELATCPRELVEYDYSGEYLISEMKRYNHNHTVISHVCYYGRDNSYTIHCVKTWPKWFTGYGLMVGYGLYPPGDKENPSRLRRLMKDDGLIGLRISPRYDPKVVWFNDPVMYPMWKEAQDLGAVFHIFLSPHQIGQVADMAERYPGVTIVIDHMAMIDIHAPDSEGFGPLLALARFPNVYIRTTMVNLSKTKEVPYRDVWPFLRRLYDRYGARRMLYANFFEYVAIKDLVPFFTPEDREWILGRTAMKIYNIKL